MATAFYTLRDEHSRVIYEVGVGPAVYEMGHFLSSIMAAQIGTETNTGVAIVNSSSEDAMVSLRLKEANGNIAATKALALRAGHQIASLITDIFVTQVSHGFQGVLEVTT